MKSIHDVLYDLSFADVFICIGIYLARFNLCARASTVAVSKRNKFAFFSI